MCCSTYSRRFLFEAQIATAVVVAVFMPLPLLLPLSVRLPFSMLLLLPVIASLYGGADEE